MPTLLSELRNKLKRVVIEARDVAEVGARAVLESFAVDHREPYLHINPAQRELRNKLRAQARQLGDRQDSSGRLAIDHLVGDCAFPDGRSVEGEGDGPPKDRRLMGDPSG